MDESEIRAQELHDRRMAREAAERAELASLRAALAERDKVIVAMREALAHADADCNWCLISGESYEVRNARLRSTQRALKDALALTPADLAGMRLISVETLKRVLACPEIADCHPEDKDPDTDALEREIRAMIGEGDSDG